MRAKLQDPTPVLVEDQLAAEVRSNNRQIHNRKFSECAVCGRKILVHLLPQHLSNCQLREATGERAPVFDVEQDRITSIATFAPHPPRNCRAINRGSSFIEWAWDPPVMDGGLPVTDYELSFDARVVEFDSVAEKYKKWTEVQPSQRTSRWGLKQPVHHHGYRLIGLRGGTEYCNFRIRCCNLRGWSEWVDMLPDRIGKQQQVC